MKDYGIRKYSIALLSIAAVVLLAFYDKMNAPAASVLAAVNVAYHSANAWIHKNGNA